MSPATAMVDQRRVALVTGVTGFVGSAIAAQLLQATEDKVLALVRGRDAVQARERVLVALRRHGVGADRANDRLAVLLGDVSQQDLGLDADRRDRLCTSLNTLYHCAASVNGALPVDQLHATNVEGTRQALALSRIANCRLVYPSSFAAVAHGASLSEHNPLGPPPESSDGYGASKYAAERLLDASPAFAAGRIVIFRLGALAGNTLNGWNNPVDERWLIVCASLAVGAAPLVSGAFRWLPVDDAARAIVELSALGSPMRRYHLRGETPTEWLQVFSWLRLNGRRLDIIDEATWRERVARLRDSRLATASVLALPRSGSESRAIEDRNTRAILRRRGLTPTAFDRRLLGVYLAAADGAAI